jgi:hypothetical protein
MQGNRYWIERSLQDGKSVTLTKNVASMVLPGGYRQGPFCAGLHPAAEGHGDRTGVSGRFGLS